MKFGVLLFLLVLIAGCGRTEYYRPEPVTPPKTEVPQPEILGTWVEGDDVNPFVHQGANGTLARVHLAYKIEANRIVVTKQCNYLVGFKGEEPNAGNLSVSVESPITLDRAQKQLKIQQSKTAQKKGAFERYCEVGVEKGDFTFLLWTLGRGDAQGWFKGLQLTERNTGKVMQFVKIAPR